MTTISALYYYPIKSCGGFRATQLETTDRGFLHDREFMLVDGDGLFLTQREYPRMALVEPRVTDDTLILKAPNMPELSIHPQQYGPAKEVIVWRSNCQAVDQGGAVAEWFSQYLETDCYLVRMAEGHIRQVNQAYAQRPNDQVSFADGYPFLLISEASLADLNSRLTEPLPMNRFRPNIVITDCAAYAEDNWQQIRLGSMQFDVVKACARCAITTINQQTAEKGKEPLKTLAGYRRVEGGGVIFGQNLLHQANGILQIGDELEIIR